MSRCFDEAALAARRRWSGKRPSERTGPIQAMQREDPVSKLAIINSPRQPAVETPQPFNILTELSKYRRLLTVKEVAAVLGSSECTIYRWSRRHQIPNVMICGARMYDPSALALWLEKKEPQLVIAARHFEQKAA